MHVATSVELASRLFADRLVFASELDGVEGGFSTDPTLGERLFSFRHDVPPPRDMHRAGPRARFRSCQRPSLPEGSTVNA
jgi:hypothetical protein